jgi:hypothetical protein
MSNEIGLAKTSQQTEVQPAPVHPDTQGVSTNERWQEIPMSIYKYFNVDIVALDDNTLEKLKFIKSWAEEGLTDKDIFSVMGRLRQEETKMGASNWWQKRLDRMYDYTKLNSQINKLLKEKEYYNGVR